MKGASAIRSTRRDVGCARTRDVFDQLGRVGGERLRTAALCAHHKRERPLPVDAGLRYGPNAHYGRRERERHQHIGEAMERSVTAMRAGLRRLGHDNTGKYSRHRVNKKTYSLFASSTTRRLCFIRGGGSTAI